MKKRIRTLIRSEGWQLVETKKVEFYQYREMRVWCNNTFAKDTWEGKNSSDIFSAGPKKFIFKRPADATMFMLKWGV